MKDREANIALAREILKAIGHNKPMAESLVLACLVEHNHRRGRSAGIDAVLIGDTDTLERVFTDLVRVREGSPATVCCEPEQLVIDVTDDSVYTFMRGDSFTFNVRGRKDWAPVGGWLVQATAYPERCDGRKLVVFEMEVMR